MLTVNALSSQCAENTMIAFGGAGRMEGTALRVASISLCAARRVSVTKGQGPPPWERNITGWLVILLWILLTLGGTYKYGKLRLELRVGHSLLLYQYE